MTTYSVPVKLSYNGRGGFTYGNGSAGFTVVAFETEAAAVAFALTVRASLMPNQLPSVRAALVA
jgi:hypothetical protein